MAFQKLNRKIHIYMDLLLFIFAMLSVTAYISDAISINYWGVLLKANVKGTTVEKEEAPPAPEPGQPDSLWDRLVQSFKNTWIGVLILAVVALVAFLSKATGLIDWVVSRFFTKPDLVVSSIDTEGRLLPLSDHPTIERHDLESPVFTGGFRARFIK
ncbi:MAG: hypothetical protein GY774_04595 [Planctomycetes bacterium]|nr:hypothetical protein [Planctomycetota bacterium]